MAMWQKILRAAALMLLFTAAFDVLIIDPAFASACTSNPFA